MREENNKINLDDLYLTEEQQRNYDEQRKPEIPVRLQDEGNSQWFERRMPYTASKVKEAIGELRYKDLLDFLDNL